MDEIARDCDAERRDGPDYAVRSGAGNPAAGNWLGNGDAGKSNMTGAGGGGKTVPLCHKEPISGDA